MWLFMLLSTVACGPSDAVHDTAPVDALMKTPSVTFECGESEVVERIDDGWCAFEISNEELEASGVSIEFLCAGRVAERSGVEPPDCEPCENDDECLPFAGGWTLVGKGDCYVEWGPEFTYIECDNLPVWIERGCQKCTAEGG